MADYIMNRLNIFKTHPQISFPAFQTTQSACFDLSFSSLGKTEYKGYYPSNSAFERAFSGFNNEIVVMPGERILVPTGLIFDIPEGYSLRVHARSGTSLKEGLVLINAEGIIDSDYVDELFILMTNVSSVAVKIKNGDRVAQAELVKTEEYTLHDIDQPPQKKTNREGGLGSTGKNKNKT